MERFVAGIPLRYRVPNGPAVFVGRARERAALRAAMDRAPLSVVVGGGGSGKSALVRHVVLAREDLRALHVLVARGESSLELRRRIAEALASVAGQAPPKTTSPEELIAFALDFAEQAALCVVIDDLHHIERDEASELLIQLASFARNSRWVVASRWNPRLAETAGQIVELGRMTEAELTELVHAWGAGADAHQAVVRAAGSPWLLWQEWRLGPGGTERAGREVLQNISDASAGMLVALSLLDHPVPQAEVGSFAPLPDEAELVALEQGGMIELTGQGISLHNSLRALLEALPERAEVRAEIAAALAVSEHPSTVLEALRLQIEDGQKPDALLARRGEWILERGYAPRLFKLLLRVDPKVLPHWRLRCAAELGNPTALRAVTAPSAPSAQDRFQWARTLRARGRVRQALEECEEALADAEVGSQARLLRARCLAHLGRVEEALADLRSDNDATQALRFYIRASFEDEGAPPALSPSASVESQLDLAEGLAALCRWQEAKDLVQPLVGAPLALTTTRRAVLLYARILAVSGECSIAAAWVERVRPFARGASLLEPWLYEVEAELALWRGPMRGAVDAVDAARRNVDVAKDLAERLRELEIEASMAVGALPVFEKDERGGSAGHARWRFGEALPPPAPEAYWDLRDLSQRAFVEGAYPAATDYALQARKAAAREGRARYEALALYDAASARIAAGLSHDGLIDELASYVGEGRTRVSAMVEFLREWRSPGALERLAQTDVVEPIARRAQHLLGLDLPLNRVEEHEVARLGIALNASVSTMGSATLWEPAWGLDCEARAVWHSNGETVSLASRRVLWRILESLIRGGGAQDKESIVHDVWEETAYHPLRHDTKLQVSIRKLRALVEHDASDPELILTTSEGYELRRPYRVFASLNRSA